MTISEQYWFDRGKRDGHREGYQKGFLDGKSVIPPEDTTLIEHQTDGVVDHVMRVRKPRIKFDLGGFTVEELQRAFSVIAKIGIKVE